MADQVSIGLICGQISIYKPNDSKCCSSRLCTHYDYLGQKCTAFFYHGFCVNIHCCSVCGKYEIINNRQGMSTEQLEEINHPAFICSKQKWQDDFTLTITHWPKEWPTSTNFGRELFGVFGQVKRIIIKNASIPDEQQANRRHEPLRYAYVTYEDVDSAVNAIKHYYFRHIKQISYARPAKNMNTIWTWKIIKQYCEAPITYENLIWFQKSFHLKLVQLLNNKQ